MLSPLLHRGPAGLHRGPAGLHRGRAVGRARRLGFALLATCALLTSCASGPDLDRAVTLADGQAVAVAYEQQESGLRQTLLTEGVVSARDLYSSGRDPLAKVLSLEEMQLLLDALATCGFFDHARPGDPGGAGVSALRVRIDGDEQSWVKHPAMDVAELTSYHEAMQTFLNLWNNTVSFHSSGGDNSVLDEAERIRRRNAEALRRRSGGEPKEQP